MEARRPDPRSKPLRPVALALALVGAAAVAAAAVTVATSRSSPGTVTSVEQVAIDEVHVADDDLTLTAHFVARAPFTEGQPCTADYSLRAIEHGAASMELVLSSTRPKSDGEVLCTAEGHGRTAETTLSQPFNGRIILQRVHGEMRGVPGFPACPPARPTVAHLPGSLARAEPECRPAVRSRLDGSGTDWPGSWVLEWRVEHAECVGFHHLQVEFGRPGYDFDDALLSNRGDQPASVDATEVSGRPAQLYDLEGNALVLVLRWETGPWRYQVVGRAECVELADDRRSAIVRIAESIRWE
jgi:hypothetical protein